MHVSAENTLDSEFLSANVALVQVSVFSLRHVIMLVNHLHFFNCFYFLSERFSQWIQLIGHERLL